MMVTMMVILMTKMITISLRTDIECDNDGDEYTKAYVMFSSAMFQIYTNRCNCLIASAINNSGEQLQCL